MAENVYGEVYGAAQAREIPETYIHVVDDWLPIGSEQSVLEIGVGKGPLLNHIQKRTTKPVYGIDLNEWILTKFKPPNSVAADATALPFASETVDRVVSMHTLEHIADVRMAFSEMTRVLKPDGKMLHVVPSPHISKAEGALIDTLRIHGFGHFLTAWREAHKLHIHNFKRYEKMLEVVAGTDMKIVKAQRVFVPVEGGFSWVYLMEKHVGEKPASE